MLVGFGGGGELVFGDLWVFGGLVRWEVLVGLVVVSSKLMGCLLFVEVVVKRCVWVFFDSDVLNG